MRAVSNTFLRGRQYSPNLAGPEAFGYQQSCIIAVDSGGLYTWTFTTPYPTGTIPVINVNAELISPGQDTVHPIIKIVGRPTETSVTVYCVLVQFSNPVVLGTGPVNLHLTASPPS